MKFPNGDQHAGDWCFVQKSPCKTLIKDSQGDYAETKHTILYCVYKGKKQVHCTKPRTLSTCACDDKRETQAGAQGDWCYLRPSSNPCQTLAGVYNEIKKDGWLRCVHRSVKQVHCKGTQWPRFNARVPLPRTRVRSNRTQTQTFRDGPRPAPVRNV